MTSYDPRMSEIFPGLAGLLHIYGQQWQIEQDRENGAWTAICRPTPTPTALRVLVAHDLAGLVTKLEATQPANAELCRQAVHQKAADPQRTSGIGCMRDPAVYE
jgi:hypothetical protein